MNIKGSKKGFLSSIISIKFSKNNKADFKIECFPQLFLTK